MFSSWKMFRTVISSGHTVLQRIALCNLSSSYASNWRPNIMWTKTYFLLKRTIHYNCTECSKWCIYFSLWHFSFWHSLIQITIERIGWEIGCIHCANREEHENVYQVWLYGPWNTPTQNRLRFVKFHTPFSFESCFFLPPASLFSCPYNPQ